MNFPFLNNKLDSIMQKRVNLSIAVSVMGTIVGLATLIFVLRGCGKHTLRAPASDETTTEMRHLNNNVIQAKQELLDEAKKAADVTREQGAKMDVQLQSIHTEINVYKNHSNAEVKRIGTFNNADILSEFSKLETGQRVATSKAAADSLTNY